MSEKTVICTLHDAPQDVEVSTIIDHVKEDRGRLRVSRDNDGNTVIGAQEERRPEPTPPSKTGPEL